MILSSLNLSSYKVIYLFHVLCVCLRVVIKIIGYNGLGRFPGHTMLQWIKSVEGDLDRDGIVH